MFHNLANGLADNGVQRIQANGLADNGVPLAGGATQANSDYLPLYDVGHVHLGLHNLTKQERHQIGQHRILIPWIRCTPLSARPFARV